MSLDDLLGNAATIAGLRRRIVGGHLGHALLLSGPESVGKTSIALGVAADILGGDGWPGELTGHPDLWIEDSETERIGIDRVRSGVEGSLQQFLSLRPYMGGARVAVIARADRLTDQAANCLLKTIEEPPPRTHLLLTAASPERLPQTVLSRCEQISLAPVEESEIASWLRASGIDDAVASTCARLAAGRPGRARALAADPVALNAELAALHRFISIAGGGVGAALAAAAELAGASGGGAEARERLLLQIAVWSGFCRDVACYAAGCPQLARWTSHAAILEAWAEAVTPGRAGAMLESLLSAAADIAAYANPRLTLEVLFLDIFAVSEAPPRVELPPIPAAPEPERPRRQRSRAAAR